MQDKTRLEKTPTVTGTAGGALRHPPFSIIIDGRQARKGKMVEVVLADQLGCSADGAFCQHNPDKLSLGASDHTQFTGGCQMAFFCQVSFMLEPLRRRGEAGASAVR